MQIEEIFSTNLMGKEVILVKNSGEVINCELIGILRDKLLIDVDGQDCSVAIDDILTLVEGKVISSTDDVFTREIKDEITEDYLDIRLAENTLTDVLGQKNQEEFNDLRCKLFIQYYDAVGLESMKNFLDIGYPISDGEKFDCEIETCLADTQFGLIRCLIRKKETGLVCDALEDAELAFNENFESKWEECKSDQDSLGGMKLLIEAECIGVPDSKIKMISDEYKNLFAGEMRSYVENYNEEKLASTVKDSFLMRSFGYTGKEIEKFNKIVDDRSFPTGKSDYEKAVRLFHWGFIDSAMQFYEKVANDKDNPKRGTAVNQLLNFALSRYDFSLFDQYFHFLSNDQCHEFKYSRVYLSLEKCPNQKIADEMEKYIIDNRTNVSYAEKALLYSLHNELQDQFENLRRDLFVTHYDKFGLNSMKDLLDIGYPIMKEENDPSKDDEEKIKWNTREETFVHEVELCLHDTQFGLIRCLIRQSETGLDCDLLSEAISKYNDSLEAKWSECRVSQDRFKKLLFLIEAECVGVDETKTKVYVDEYQDTYKKEIRPYVENCDQNKLAAMIEDPFLMRTCGYTGKDINKFQKILENKSYPMGKSNYDKAVRLVMWGFVDDGMRYYEKVASDKCNIKNDTAVNQLLNYALIKKDYQLFDRYYETLDKNVKKKDRIRQFKQQELYEKGEYEQLYSIYAANQVICSDYAVKGAFIFSMGRETDVRREELTQKVLVQKYFDGNLWLEALEKAYAVSADMYRDILWDVMKKNSRIVFEHLGNFYQFLLIDPSFEWIAQTAPVEEFFSEKYPIILPCVIYQEKENELDDVSQGQYFSNAVVSMERLLEQMDFENTKILGEFFCKKDPNNEDIFRIIEIAQKGLNAQDRMPAGQDDYSVGRRLLLLNGDKENAYLHFQNGIENSDDQKQIALCGAELFKELMDEKKYSEVIFWGKKILLEKKVLNYSSLIIDLKTSIEKCNNESEKEDFINELIQCSEEAKHAGNYAQMTEFLNAIFILDPEHNYIQENWELLELTNQGKINWEDDSFLGTVNRIRYVENDNSKYASMLLEGFESGAIDAYQITDAAVAYINVCSDEGWDDKLFCFIDNIAKYQISMNDHLVTILFNLIEQKKGIQSAILYFTSFWENAQEDRKILFLSRLEQLYERTVLDDVEINLDTALNQMYTYIKSGASVRTKYCYDALLIRNGEIEAAKEIFALLRGEPEGTDNMNELAAWIWENYFKDDSPSLADIFAEIVKEKTLLQLTEHVKDKKKFVVFSSEEKKISNKMNKSSSYRIDLENPIERNTLLKEIYFYPDKWKNWYLYFLIHRNDSDSKLLYCIDINLSILDNGSVGLENKYAHYAKQFCKNNPEIENRYGGYWRYNKLYKMYLNKTYQNNQVVVNDIYNMSSDKHFFKGDASLKSKMARDYIYLFNLMDDRSDYIYIKGAKFLATNYGCAEYFYNLFHNDLLLREQDICLNLCIELLVRHKRASDKDLVSKILCEMDEVATEHKQTVSALKSLCETGSGSEIHAVCSLLHAFPKNPAPKEIQRLDLLDKDIDFAIKVLRIADECLGNSLEIKKLLFQVQSHTGKRVFYEDLYQENLSIIRMAQTEKQMYDACCTAVVLATALGKKGWYADILDLYQKQTLDNYYISAFSTFCNAAEKIDEKDSCSSYFLKALISDDWSEIYVQFGVLKSAITNAHMRVLLEYKLDVFVKAGLEYLNEALFAEVNSQISDRKDELNQVFQLIFEDPLDDVLEDICGMGHWMRNLFIDLTDPLYQNVDLSEVPDSESFIKPLVHVWSLVYKKEDLLCFFIEMNKKIVSFNRLMYAAITQLQIPELLNYYSQFLFQSKSYRMLLALNKSVDWAKESFDFRCYYIVALFLTDYNAGIDEIVKIDNELFIVVILLLMKVESWDGIEKIKSYIPLERKTVDCIEHIYLQKVDDMDMIDRIENDIRLDAQIGMYKLLYAQTVDDEVRNLLENRIEDVMSVNRLMFELRSKERRERDKIKSISVNNISSSQIENSMQVETTKSEPDFVMEAMRDLELDQVSKNERKALWREYEDLGRDIKDNLEYRRDHLAKLCYITSDPKDLDEHTKYIIMLGVVLFYGTQSVNHQRARELLYQTIPFVSNDTKMYYKTYVRNAALEMLSSFGTMKEIFDDSENLIECLSCIINNLNFSKNGFFARQLEGILNSLVQIPSLTSIAQIERTYSQVIHNLNNLMNSCERDQEWRAVFGQWNRLAIRELNRIKRGAVLTLEMETRQCQAGVRGKICGVIRNVGNKMAENIHLKVIFGDSIRCKESEHIFPIIYGQDLKTFAFSIRCQDEGEFKYHIELFYEMNQEKFREEVSEEIRIVAQNDYEHIGNLYSIQPVTSNDEFYGREKEVDDIFGYLNDVNPNTSIVMYGLKRVGKTSMLRFIERAMVDSDIYIPIYKSAQSAGEQNSIKNMFVQTIIDALENRGMVDEKCHSFGEYNYNTNPERLYDFYLYLQNANLMEGKRILFMADEIEEIFYYVDRGVVNQGFYKVLRVILQELTSIRFIFCGADHLTDILQNHSLADVFEITKRIQIKRLDEESMRRMVIEPAKDKISYTDKAVDRIWNYTCGHTYYSKQICNKIIDILNEEKRVTAFAYDVDTAIRQVMIVTEYFLYLSKFLSKNDRQVIRIMCDNLHYSKEKVSYEVLEECYDGTRLSDILNGLVFRDIIDEPEPMYDTDYYHFSIEMFRLWFSKEVDSKKVGEE